MNTYGLAYGNNKPACCVVSYLVPYLGDFVHGVRHGALLSGVDDVGLENGTLQGRSLGDASAMPEGAGPVLRLSSTPQGHLLHAIHPSLLNPRPMFRGTA